MPESIREAAIELSAELVVREFSDAARALYGLQERNVRGGGLADILLTDSGRIDWPAHWAGVLAGRPFERVMLHRSCSGLRVWVLCRLEAQAQGARLWVRRASGREVLEVQPGGVVGALGKMLAVGGVGLWMDDRIANELDWSPYARMLHDVSPDGELTPSMLFGQIHPDDRNRVAGAIQACMAARVPYDGVLRVKHGEHDFRQLRVFGGPAFDAEGLELVAVGGVVDLSEVAGLRSRVGELEDQLRAAQRGDVVGRLAGGVAHDFNNALTAILGCCELLAFGELSPDQQEDVQQIRTATLRAGDLTRQLLAFGRRQVLRPRAVEPALVLAEVLSLLRRTVPANVELRLMSVDTSGCVLVDVTQLHQVLTNLVVNAAQAMPSGGRVEIGVAEVTLAEANVASERSGKHIRFVVEDTGPGVPHELQSRIFEPFFSTKPLGQGSGLGLSVVQGIVEQHRGHILVREGSCGGARFEVYLPATEQTPEAPSDMLPSREEVPESEIRVLLVEDEKMVRELTKRVLVGAGVHVTEAGDASEALQRSAERPFDVLLTDVVLPAMSGPELAACLREKGFDFRVVYMSGYPVEFVESQVRLAANDVLVHKPFTAASLLRALRQLPR